MTRFAPPTLYQCPACAGYFKRSGFRSLYFDDAIPEWSDGRNGNWWARASGSVGRCPSCSGIVWMDDAVALMPAPNEPRPMGRLARIWHQITGDRSGSLRNEHEWDALPDGIKGAERIDSLQNAQDFIEALAGLPLDALDREVHLRQRLWWVSNDHQRLGGDGRPMASQPAVGPAESRANILRLLELFEHDLKRQVERGELLRQLGRFDEAAAVLKALKPDGYSEVKAVKIERLAQALITELRVL